MPTSKAKTSVDVAVVAAELERLHVLGGNLGLASARIETALVLAEALWLPDVLAQALITKAVIASLRSRNEEAFALMERGQKLALAHELAPRSPRAYNNLADQLGRRDHCEEAVKPKLEQGLVLARRVGDRGFERILLGELLVAGAHRPVAEALECIEQVPEEPVESGTFLLVFRRCSLPGGSSKRRGSSSPFAPGSGSVDVQERVSFRAAQAVVLAAEGKERGRSTPPKDVLAGIAELGPMDQESRSRSPWRSRRSSRSESTGERSSCWRTIETLPPGRLAPSLRARASLSRRLAATNGDGSRAEAAGLQRRRPRPSARPACRSGSRSR